jgi:hypothetical protein
MNEEEITEQSPDGAGRELHATSEKPAIINY